MEHDPTPENFLAMYGSGNPKPATPSGPAAPATPATSKSTPAAGASTATAPAVTIDEVAPAATASHFRVPTFALLSGPRALRLLLLVICLAVFGTAVSRMEAARPRTGTQAKKTAAVAGPKPAAYGVAQALKSAAAYHQSHGTYVGFTAPGTLVASGKSNVVVSTMARSGMCSYGGIVNGAEKGPLNDPSATACDPTKVAQAQAAIRSQELAALTGPTSVHALVQAGSDASFYASMHGGSLNGITFSDPTVTPIGNVGAGVLVHVTTDSGCAQSVVSANGTYSTPRPC